MQAPAEDGALVLGGARFARLPKTGGSFGLALDEERAVDMAAGRAHALAVCKAEPAPEEAKLVQAFLDADARRRALYIEKRFYWAALNGEICNLKAWCGSQGIAPGSRPPERRQGSGRCRSPARRRTAGPFAGLCLAPVGGGIVLFRLVEAVGLDAPSRLEVAGARHKVVFDGLELVNALDGGPRVGEGPAGAHGHEIPRALVAAAADPFALVLEQALAALSLGDLHDPLPYGAEFLVGFSELGGGSAHLLVFGVGEGEAGAGGKQAGKEESKCLHGMSLRSPGREVAGVELYGGSRARLRSAGQ